MRLVAIEREGSPQINPAHRCRASIARGDHGTRARRSHPREGTNTTLTPRIPCPEASVPPTPKHRNGSGDFPLPSRDASKSDRLTRGPVCNRTPPYPNCDETRPPKTARALAYPFPPRSPPSWYGKGNGNLVLGVRGTTLHVDVRAGGARICVILRGADWGAIYASGNRR